MILLINVHLMTLFSVGIFDEEHGKNKETIFDYTQMAIWVHTVFYGLLRECSRSTGNVLWKVHM